MRAFVTAGLFALALTLVATAQDNRIPAPEFPKETASVELDLLKRTSSMLARGEFETAAKYANCLAAPSNVKVYINSVSIPRTQRETYVAATNKAIAAWNAALNGAIKFAPTTNADEADLILLYEWDVAEISFGQFKLICSDTRISYPVAGPGQEPDFSRKRAGFARISLKIPYTENMHTVDSIQHLTGHALGSYLGLAPTSSEEDFMGPDWHSDKVALTPSANDVKRALALQQGRAKLAQLAQARTVVYMPKPILVLEKMEYHAGDVMRGDSAWFEVKVRNSGDAPLEIEAKPTCGCTVANYDKVIPAKSEGIIKAEMKTAGYRGEFAKSIEITSNDPDKPLSSVRIGCTIVQGVQILPSEAHTLTLNDTGPTVQEFELRVSPKLNAQITRVTSNVPYVEAALEKTANGDGVYKVKATVKPEAPIGRSIFLLTVQTTSINEPQVTISVSCEKGIIVMPISVWLGAITPTTPLPIEQTVTMVKRSGPFKITSVENSDPAMTHRIETIQDGSQYRLIIGYKGGWPLGQARKTIIVNTDDPNQPKIEITVMANLLGG